MWKRNLEVKLTKPIKGVELHDDEEDGIDRIAYYAAAVNNTLFQIMKLGVAYMAADTARQILVKKLSK